MLAAIVSALHLLALGVGLPAVYLRGRALKGPLDEAGLRRLFGADNIWGVAAVVWIATGLFRAFGGLEKGSAFYLASTLFWTKMTLFALLLALEAWPMSTFIRWRIRASRGQAPDTSRARALFAVNHAEMTIAIAMVFVAAFMARGFGAR
jgi:putative membrane protein